MALVPCATCRRHVLEAEGACPFCGAARAEEAPRPLRVLAGRFSRAALFTMGASTLVACSDVKSAYGGSPYDADVSVEEDASVDGAVDTKVPDTAVPDTADETISADAPDAADASDAADTGFAGAYGGPPPDAGGG